MRSHTQPRVLILGGSGMLGHKTVQVFAQSCRVIASFREPGEIWPKLALTAGSVQAVGGVDAADFGTVRRVVAAARPDVVINCIGVVKQLQGATDAERMMWINALFPHRLADLCGSMGVRLIHVSTDCVFSGTTGGYRESDVPDAEDLYGRSKQLGEVIRPDCLTLRTSIIGREITKAVGLLEWFIQQRGGSVNGFTRAIFSGLTTLELARILLEVVSDHAGLAGLYHVASDPISKHDLLQTLDGALDLGIDIHPVDEPIIDRSLDGSRFTAATGITVSSWHRMISELAEDPTPYDELRGQHGST